MEALRLATLGAAEASGTALVEGSLEAGKRANLAVLDRDPSRARSMSSENAEWFARTSMEPSCSRTIARPNRRWKGGLSRRTERDELSE